MVKDKTRLESFQEWFKSQTKYRSQAEFARAIEIPRRTISHYLRGEEKPSEERRKILYEVTGLECFKTEIKLPEKKEPEKIKTPLDMQEKVAELQKIISDLSERVNSFNGMCEKCIANKLLNSPKESSVKEKVEIVKELLYALNRELEFFKHDSPESRALFRQSINVTDVGYIIALLKALFDEDKFQSWLYMCAYEIKRR